MQETWVQSLGWEDPLEEEMAAHSSTLAWRIPRGRSLVGYSPWGRKESDMTERRYLTSFHVTLDFGDSATSVHVDLLIIFRSCTIFFVCLHRPFYF